MENRIPLKTDCEFFNQDDFIQTECGTMRELTVTITLHEYRELVQNVNYWRDKATALLLQRKEKDNAESNVAVKAEAEG